MSPKKPKEFLFKKKGWWYKGIGKENVKNRQAGMIYLSNTQLMITFKDGGEFIYPVNTIKKLNRHRQTWREALRITIQTDTGKTYTFTTDYLKKLYRLLSEVIANLPDGN